MLWRIWMEIVVKRTCKGSNHGVKTSMAGVWQTSQQASKKLRKICDNQPIEKLSGSGAK